MILYDYKLGHGGYFHHVHHNRRVVMKKDEIMEFLKEVFQEDSPSHDWNFKWVRYLLITILVLLLLGILDSQFEMYFCWILLFLPVLLLIALLLRYALKAEETGKLQTAISYPVYFGFTSNGCYHAAEINRVFGEVEKYFANCYFHRFEQFDRTNLIRYEFKFIESVEFPVCYELVELIQSICEKILAEQFIEYGITADYSSVVVCAMKPGKNIMQLGFAYSSFGEKYIINLRNQVYKAWHKDDENGSQPPTMTEVVPDIKFSVQEGKING